MSDLTPEQRAEQLLERAQIKNYPHLKGLYMPILPALIDAIRDVEQRGWEALKKYVVHLPNCTYSGLSPEPSSDKGCVCGLDATLRGEL